jgi:hypothetical protein
MARARDARSLKRRGPQREPYDYVLIVCEGSKTEPNYLSEMIRDFQISGANVKVTGDCGSAPQTVVAEAIRLFEQDPRFDRVFCVFDRDGHAGYADALQRIDSHRLLRRDGRKKLGHAQFTAINSVPCFEYWILLHFEYTTAHMARYSDVEPRMRNHAELRDYSKGSAGLFGMLRSRMDDALRHADMANAASAATGSDNPSTRMPELVRYLDSLK